MAQCSRVPQSWTSKSQKKTHRRYWTPFIEKKLASLIEAEGAAEAAQKDTLRALFATFDEHAAVWRGACACVALLDSLLSLAAVSACANYCWPEIESSGTAGAELVIDEGRHPMLEHSLSADRDYIPNSLSLGSPSVRGAGAGAGAAAGAQPRLMLLSGPNMGGKSTLLRQTCLIAIMAQMGCKVPASRCRLTPVDRIFTRVGASDKILAGQSTFFVELAETATILRQATEVSEEGAVCGAGGRFFLWVCCGSVLGLLWVCCVLFL